jgi:hypothetical protein
MCSAWRWAEEQGAVEAVGAQSRRAHRRHKADVARTDPKSSLLAELTAKSGFYQAVKAQAEAMHDEILRKAAQIRTAEFKAGDTDATIRFFTQEVRYYHYHHQHNTTTTNGANAAAAAAAAAATTHARTPAHTSRWRRG